MSQPESWRRELLAELRAINPRGEWSYEELVLIETAMARVEARCKANAEGALFTSRRALVLEMLNFRAESSWYGPTNAEVDEYMARLASQPGLADKLREVLAGIDKTTLESDEGWWETSVGAAFGAGKLAAVIALVASLSGCALGPYNPDDYRPGGKLNHVYYDLQAARCCCRR